MAKLRALERTAWLERARDASSDADVLANLLGAWRAAPLAAVHELIAVAGVRAAQGRAIAASAAWMEVAARHDPAELDWVLANLPVRRVDQARERAGAIAAWPDDPRIAPELVRLLVRTPLRGRTSRPFWTAVFRIVHRRFHRGVEQAIADVDAAELDGDFGGYVRMKLATLRRRLAALTPESVDGDTRMLLDAIAAKLDIAAAATVQKSLDDFVREIWAAPLDDGLREVFADWLIARDDPRGELIMLQLTRKRRGLDAAAQKRGVALLREHARAWMGPLELAVDKKQFRFEGGFLYACRINPRGMTPALMTHPAWATVREYVLDTRADAELDRWLDHMIALGAKRR